MDSIDEPRSSAKSPTEPSLKNGSETETESSSQTPQNKIPTHIASIAIPVLVAIVALVGTYLGAMQAYKTSVETQRVQIAEERGKVEREKRADIYLKFLDAASRYSNQYVTTFSSCAYAHMGGMVIFPPPEAESPENLIKRANFESCILMSNETAQARNELTASRNGVYVYGSDQANDQADSITKDMLTKTADRPINYSFSFGSESQAYKDFQTVVCHEVPPNPRASC